MLPPAAGRSNLDRELLRLVGCHPCESETPPGRSGPAPGCCAMPSSWGWSPRPAPGAATATTARAPRAPRPPPPARRGLRPPPRTGGASRHYGERALRAAALALELQARYGVTPA